jgi:glycosyltransferase involved in cell wall biosynthesis
VQQVTVISTVLNEANSIASLLDSLLRQTRPPNEIVIVDGGSCDGTREILERYARSAQLPLHIRSLPGSNISQGRNAAISAAHGTLIAATDAGVHLEDDWLEQLLAPFMGDDPADVVGGFSCSDPRSVFELALGAVTLPLLEEIGTAHFYPSSRCVAFRRSAWQAVGGYPEWLDYCEDLLFDFALADAGYRFAFAPRAVAHFRPRDTLRAFFRQYYRYARGDGKADFWRYRHLVRYGTYVVVLPSLIALTVISSSLWLLALAAGLAAMLRKPLLRLRPVWGKLSLRERWGVLGWLPIIRLVGDVAKMLGYPVGVCWRLAYAPAGTWAKRQF